MTTPSTSSDASSTSTPKQYNLRNPLPLSAPQEQEVKLLYYKRVRAHCAPEIKGMQLCLLLRLYDLAPATSIALDSQIPVKSVKRNANPALVATLYTLHIFQCSIH